MLHEDEPQELFPSRFGCTGSRIPDRKPSARIKTLRTDGFPKYQLLVKTIRTTLFSCGRFPKHLKDSDFIESLADEAVTKASPLLRGRNADIVAGAKSIVRQLIHREKQEFRWFETDEATGKKVRKSKALLRVKHPVQRHGEENADPFNGAAGDLEWDNPLNEVGVDADGRLTGVTAANYNEVESRMVAHLDRLSLRLSIINHIGADNLRWMTEYTERKGDGTLVNADHQRWNRLKTKVRKVVRNRP
jgi:hypothetical protein